MTYCLAWRNDAYAFLIADSAVTSGRAPQQTHTSFGEAHIIDGTENVEEGALKIIPVGNGAVSFAGDADIGYSFVKMLTSRIDSGLTPEDAFQSAVVSHTPFTAGKNLSVLFAYHSDKENRLRSFNANGDMKVEEHSNNEVVQIGSLRPGTFPTRISDAYIQRAIKIEIDGYRLLVCGMALCQLYGILNNLMQFGVGGTFSGGVVAGDSFYWQPDISYMLFDPKSFDPQVPQSTIVTMVRDDVLVVGSTVAQVRNRVFPSVRPSETIENARERSRKASELVFEKRKTLQFHYVVMLSTRTPTAVVIEMGDKQKHRDLFFVVHDQTAYDTKCELGISPTLWAILRDAYDAHVKAASNAGMVSGPVIHFQPYRYPEFDIKHERFEVTFHHDLKVEPKIRPDVMAAYEAAKDTGPIFIQDQNGQKVGAAHMVEYWLRMKGKKFEDCIPEDIKRPEGGSDVLPFEINFTPGSLYMMTDVGAVDIKQIVLFVRVTWLRQRTVPGSSGDMAVIAAGGHAPGL